MSIFDKIKDIVSDSDDDDFDDFYDESGKDTFGIAPPKERVSRRERAQERADKEERYTERPRMKRHDSDKVVNIHTTTQLQVVLVKPDRFDNVSEIAEHLRSKHAVVLNLEATNKDIARRLVDFLSGCAYALDGKIKKIAISTYIITPYNVDIIGDLIDELENNGLYL